MLHSGLAATMSKSLFMCLDARIRETVYSLSVPARNTESLMTAHALSDLLCLHVHATPMFSVVTWSNTIISIGLLLVSFRSQIYRRSCVSPARVAPPTRRLWPHQRAKNTRSVMCTSAASCLLALCLRVCHLTFQCLDDTAV